MTISTGSADRVELFDGSLFLTVAPGPRHQHLSFELAAALTSAARRAGLHVREAVNVRLCPDRIVIPDLVITSDIDFHEPVVDAASVRLVCEVVAPHNAATDEVLKMHCYAAAGISWYLLVEQDTGTLRLFRLDGGKYAEHATAEVGQVLELTDPVRVTIDPRYLLSPT
ncbi:MAG TPA: Uma2 family endonuclease [Actinoplanes sp.]|nr:Uma2 family endonuclease [Actinoplanes sp.]